MSKVNFGAKIVAQDEEIKLLRVCLEQERLKNASLVERLRMVEIAARGEKKEE
jgi:hypothetical protein